MEKLLNLVVSGTVSGAIYSLIASGLVLTYNASGVFNLGYGAIAFVAAFLYYELHVGVGWPVLPAALTVVGVFCPMLGLALDRLIFRRLAGAGDAAKVMATVGVLVALPAMVRYVFTSVTATFGWSLPTGDQVFAAPGIGPSPKQTWRLPGRIILDSNQLIVFAAAALIAMGLYVFLVRTPLGLRMRATVDAPGQAELAGIDTDRMPTIAWCLGTVITGLAGVVAAPVFNSLDPGTYTTTVFVATAAVVLARMTSIPLAFTGGLLIGVLQNLVVGYAGFAAGIPGFSSSVPFVLLLAGLLVLGRDRRRVAGALADVGAPTGPATITWTIRQRTVFGVAVGVYVVYIVAVADPFWVATNLRGLAFGLIFLSFVVVTGMGGLINLAPAAFSTAAGLGTGLLIGRLDLPCPLALLGGVAFAVALGLVAAIPALRLGGLSLALATLALAFVADRVLFSWTWLTNYQAGWTIERPSLLGIDLGDDRTLTIVMLVVLWAVSVAINNLRRSPTGRAVLAMRNSQPAAATSGMSPAAGKLTIFVVGAVVAGLGGAILATFDGNAVRGSYPASLGLTWFAAVVLWGIRRPASAIIAGLSTALLPAVLSTGVHLPDPIPGWLSWDGTRSSYVPAILFGLGAIQMAQDPDGVLSLMGRQRAARAARRAARAATTPPESDIVMAVATTNFSPMTIAPTK